MQGTLREKLLNKRTLETYSLILIVLGLFIVLSVITRTFFTTSNLLNVLRQISINGILAIGMTFVVLTGGSIPLKSIVSHEYAFKDLIEGVAYNVDNKQDVIKAVIKF
jgi:predicted ABC-type sugar transport system permease subunit